VLFLDLKQYGAHYQVLSSTVVVEVAANWSDTRTGILLWKATARLNKPPTAQATYSATDRRRHHRRRSTSTPTVHTRSARLGNANLFFPRGRPDCARSVVLVERLRDAAAIRSPSMLPEPLEAC